MNDIKIRRKPPGLGISRQSVLSETSVPKGESVLVERPKSSSVDQMMSNVYAILHQQIDRIRIKSLNYSLEPEEVSALRDYTRSLIELSKEEREMVKADAASGKLSELSTEELIELLGKTAKKNK